ncbi:MAG: hypothetical protein ABR607_02180 [Pyrinomonadaceae bacterium]
MIVAVNINPTVLNIPDEELFSKTASEAEMLINSRVRQWLESAPEAINWNFEAKDADHAIAA